MTKQADHNSKRSQKRRERGFTASRANRRAARRLHWALGAYKPSESGSHEPGSKKYW
ncbi:MAG: hypothetical protein ACOH2V_00680 [Candidatus Saccharimonadaceae bacterium]